MNRGMNGQPFFTNNSWWGKILGGFFGYLMAQSTGALLGILIGNFFDKGLAIHFSRLHHSYHQEKRETVQAIFFEATFAVMGHIAKSDGRVSENEIQMAQQVMTEIRLNKAQKTRARHYFNSGKDPAYHLERILSMLQDSCYDNPELLKLFMDIQYRTAQVDGLSPKKLEALDFIFQRLGFAPLKQQYRFYDDFGFQNDQSSSYQHRYCTHNNSTHSSSLAQAYDVLEVKEGASKQEVKRAYRRCISRNHPDKLIAQGLPEAMIKIANDKTQQITKAYEHICTSKGW